MQDLVTGYLAHLATEQVTKSTHKTYRQRLRQFTTWLDAEGKTFDRASVIGYVDACQQHHKPRTIRPAMAAIRDLAAWMVATGREAPDLAGVKGPSLNPPNRYTPTNEEMQAFWTAAKTLPGFTFPERFARGRATVLLCLAACTAIRRFELLAIQVADVQLEDEAPVLRIRRGKGAKYREIAINAEAQGVLREWLQLRREWAKKVPARAQNPWLLPVDAVRPLGDGALDALIARLNDAAGLRRVRADGRQANRITLHGIRHWAASRMAKAGVSLKTISEILGHSQLSTTAMYLHTSEPEKQEAVSHLSLDAPIPPPEPPASTDSAPAEPVRGSRRREDLARRRRRQTPPERPYLGG